VNGVTDATRAPLEAARAAADEPPLGAARAELAQAALPVSTLAHVPELTP
jgi:hypothetical protein